MPFRTHCTIYKPIPIFHTGYVRSPVVFEQLDVYVEFRDEFHDWISKNLSGYCKIVEYTVDSAVLEFEFKEDLILFDLTWR